MLSYIGNLGLGELFSIIVWLIMIISPFVALVWLIVEFVRYLRGH